MFLETKPSEEGSAEPTQPGVLSAGACSVLPEGRSSAGAPAAEEDAGTREGCARLGTAVGTAERS